MNNVSTKTRNLAKLSILAAISIVLVALIHFP
ncbi:MAG TPA: ECF transporter S component, partial [Clostridiales bacterium]|nr:ECF transporter S component [Clostridiales bacterium]